MIPRTDRSFPSIMDRMKFAVGRLRLAALSALALAVVVVSAVTMLVPFDDGVSVSEGAPAVSAARVEERTLWSTALGRSMPYSVYLPAGYDSQSSTRYPVLYMLHGLGGDHQEWQRYGLFDSASELMASGEISPMIIVTPEGERGYWVDHAGGGPRFGTYVSRDLVDAVDAEFRTFDDRSARAIGGMSMGGHGALQLALNNPDEFAVVGAHSVALRRFDEAFPFFGDRKYFEAHDPVSICDQDEARAERLQIWVDIGTNDQWYGAAQKFHQQLTSEGLRHTWNAFDGGHDAQYWSGHLDDYLRYYSGAFVTQASLALAP